MTLEEGVFNYVSAQAEVQALLKEPERTRFFKLAVPQSSKMPATVQQRTGTQRQQLQCRIDRTVQATIQIDHYGRSLQAAGQLGQVVMAVLHGAPFPVMMGSVKVKDAFCVNEFDLDDPEPGLYRRSQSWRFWYVE